MHGEDRGSSARNMERRSGSTNCNTFKNGILPGHLIPVTMWKKFNFFPTIQRLKASHVKKDVIARIQAGTDFTSGFAATVKTAASEERTHRARAL